MEAAKHINFASIFDDGGRRQNLEKPAADNIAMSGYWDKIDAILGGVETMKQSAKDFLPKLPNESKPEWDWRVSVSKFTNVFRDIVEDLSQRPFSEEIKVDEPPPEIEAFISDVDGAGTDITGFGAATMFSGIARAIDWIFVDFPNVPDTVDGRVRTREDDQRLNIRPFWNHVLARNVLEVRTSMIGGAEVLTYMRVLEPAGNGLKDRVRIMERFGASASWSVWEKVDTQANASVGASEWEQVDAGIFSIGEIPMVPFMTGRRKGRSWQFDPLMRDAAELQIQLYQDESALKHSKTMSAFVMIAANGVKPERKGVGDKAEIVPLTTGPGAVLYGGYDGKGNPGSFELLEPSAQSMTFLSGDIEKTKQDLRELGRQPLTAQSGNLTTITAGVAATKGNSAVSAWAILLGKTMENALRLTSLWLRLTGYEPKVNVYKDFDIDGQGDDMTTLNAARKNGDLSQRSYWKELQRRGMLSADFDPDDEEKALLDEIPADQPLDANGNPVDPSSVVPFKKTGTPQRP